MTEPRSQINSWFLASKGKSKKKERKKKSIYLPSFPALMKMLPILAITLFLRKELISIIIYLQSYKKNKGIWHKAGFLAWKSATYLSSRGDCTGILVWNRGMHFYLLLEEFWWINQMSGGTSKAPSVLPRTNSVKSIQNMHLPSDHQSTTCFKLS